MRVRLDPFLVALIAALGLAAVLPASGAAGAALSAGSLALIALLFFFNGAKLPRDAILSALGSWRFQLGLLAFTFALYPLLGLAARALFAPTLPPELALGLLFVTLAPSTVQSSVAFTALAKGDVASAVAGAAASNIVGVALTPLLAAALLGGVSGGIGWEPIVRVAALLLLPFTMGHLARPLLGGWVERNVKLVSLIDRASIVLIVYAAASAAVSAGAWALFSAPDLAWTIAACLALLAAATLAALALSSRLDAPRRAAFLMCGTQKSLAAGAPMATLLFGVAAAGGLILPLIIYHQAQLMVAAVLARGLARRSSKADGA